MPEYQCHKVVHAAEILDIEGLSGGGYNLKLDGPTLRVEAKYAIWYVPADWYDKHQPKPGGYFVKYKDGYTSYSPAEAFEDGYTLLNPAEKEMLVKEWTTEDRVSEIHRLINLVLDNQDKERAEYNARLNETMKDAFLEPIREYHRPGKGIPIPIDTEAIDDDPWKHRSDGMKCRTCMWYVEKANGLKRNKVGRCRRHCPSQSDGMGYPVVFPHDWCGDHKLNELAV